MYPISTPKKWVINNYVAYKNVSAWGKINHNVYHFNTSEINEHSELTKNSCTTGHTRLLPKGETVSVHSGKFF